MKNLLTFILGLSVTSALLAQSPILPLDIPVPASKQTSAITLTNATIHTATGNVIENGFIQFVDGKIKSIGTQKPASISNTDEIIDCSGKHIYPGLIALNTALGLREIEAVRATNDYREVGEYNPHIRSLIAYNAESRVTPTVRSNGILFAQPTPNGGIISGTSSLVHLDAWNFNDAVVVEDDVMHLFWPVENRPTRWWDKDQSKSIQVSERYSEQLQALQTLFADAKAYISGTSENNQRLEAVQRLFKGRTNLFIHVSSAPEILAALNLANQWDIQPVLVGAEEALLVTEAIRKMAKGVIVMDVHKLPSSDDASVTETYTFPAKLAEAKIPFSIAVDGYWQIRNLPFHVGTAIAHGLDPEIALQSVTRNAAKFSGAPFIGSLEVGNEASLIVTTGDVFDMNVSTVEIAFIQGRRISLDNHQKSLYTKYGKKLGQMK